MPISCLAWSPDDTRLAVGGGQAIPRPAPIHVYDAATLRRLAVARYHRLGIWALVYSDTGVLASSSHDYSVVLWNIDANDACFVAGGPHEGRARGALLFRGGALYTADVMTWGQSAELVRIDLTTGQRTTLLTLEEDLGIDYIGESFDADELVLLVSDTRNAQDYEVRRIKPNGELVARFPSPLEIPELVCTAGGLVIVGQHDERDVTVLCVLDSAGGVVREALLESERCSVSVDRSGSHLVVVDGKKVQRRTLDLEIVAELELTHDAGVSAWSHAGDRVAVSTNEWTIHVLDADTWREIVPPRP